MILVPSGEMSRPGWLSRDKVPFLLIRLFILVVVPAGLDCSPSEGVSEEPAILMG